jgi:hypothetical protein
VTGNTVFDGSGAMCSIRTNEGRSSARLRSSATSRAADLIGIDRDPLQDFPHRNRHIVRSSRQYLANRLMGKPMNQQDRWPVAYSHVVKVSTVDFDH